MIDNYFKICGAFFSGAGDVNHVVPFDSADASSRDEALRQALAIKVAYDARHERPASIVVWRTMLGFPEFGRVGAGIGEYVPESYRAPAPLAVRVVPIMDPC